MSWPHALSVSRIAAGAPIAVLILVGQANARLCAAVIFGVAALTDLLDGPLARRSRGVGPLGIYLDTTGDKVLVSVVLIAMSAAHLVDAWMVMIIVGREFLVSGVRTLAAIQGFVISANFAGKLKTMVTLTAMFLVLMVASARDGGSLHTVGHIATWGSVAWYGMVLAVALTVISGAKYLFDGRPMFVSAGQRTRAEALTGADSGKSQAL